MAPDLDGDLDADLDADLDDEDLDVAGLAWPAFTIFASLAVFFSVAVKPFLALNFTPGAFWNALSSFLAVFLAVG